MSDDNAHDHPSLLGPETIREFILRLDTHRATQIIDIIRDLREHEGRLRTGNQYTIAENFLVLTQFKEAIDKWRSEQEKERSEYDRWKRQSRPWTIAALVISALSLLIAAIKLFT